MRVGVIDYGVGNLGSVLRALEELRVTPVLLSRATEVDSVDSLILPGVGGFTDCARLLEVSGWKDALLLSVGSGNTPLLGICVGMQLLASSGTEGAVAGGDSEATTSGLGLISGRVEHLRTLGCALRVPHIGWNSIKYPAHVDPLFHAIPEGTDFYFVHSYTFIPTDSAAVIATVDYGTTVTAAIRQDHVWGTQFHPEKSSRAGFKLLRNFIEETSC